MLVPSAIVSTTSIGSGGGGRYHLFHHLPSRHLPPPPRRNTISLRTRSSTKSNGGDYSYLDMWKNAVDRRHSKEISDITLPLEKESEEENIEGKIEEKTEVFKKILDIPKEERDRVQRLQVIDRANAAISAARALLKEYTPQKITTTTTKNSGGEDLHGGMQGEYPFSHQSGSTKYKSPGPDFWSWTPPPESPTLLGGDVLQVAKELNLYPLPSTLLMEKEQYADILPLPFESTLHQSTHSPPLPPLQSLMEFEKVEREAPTSDLSVAKDKDELGVVFSGHAIEAADALEKTDEASSFGLNPDGSKWWRETGVEQRPDGVVCKWTLIRGVSADESVEWEDKFWEASDQFDYKELGSEKSGRDADGNVWHEYWKESMWQDLRSGLMHMEKTADKWGKNGYGNEWQEQWLERYDASGRAEKWAHKWCSIDPSTPLAVGHAHVWHERWGEKYDGKGGSMKYTDKWAERSELDGRWSKWGDKWDEHFDPNAHGLKQGETWWEGPGGDRWNRTWGEQHNGSGWVHKYGKSSCGEHWDTHEQQDTWYERCPHFGFEHCFENSVHLRAVRKQA